MKVICYRTYSAIYFDRDDGLKVPKVFNRSYLQIGQEYDVYSIVHYKNAVYYLIFVAGYFTFLYADYFSIVDHSISSGVSAIYNRNENNGIEDYFVIGFSNLIHSNEFKDFDLFPLSKNKVEYIINNYKI